MTLDWLDFGSIVFPVPVIQRYSSSEFMAQIEAQFVPPDQVALWFLGQNAWILKAGDGTILAIDPYLTDGCASGNSGVRTHKSRLLPVFLEPEDLRADFVLITHSHPDHCDPYTLRRLGCRNRATFLAPFQCLEVLASAGVPRERTMLMHPLQSAIFPQVKVTGTFALPTGQDDLNHMGYLLQFPNGKVYYNTGDTSYSELLAHVREAVPDVMCICINGGYHNLSHWEAARVAALVRPKLAIPSHFDMMPHNIQHPHMFRKSLLEQDASIRYMQLDYYACHLF